MPYTRENIRGKFFTGYRSLILFEVFGKQIIHVSKGNFPLPLQFSWILLHVSTMRGSDTCIPSELSFFSPVYSFSTLN